MHVKSLHIYPVKSTHVIDTDHAMLTPRGLAGDRRWLLIDADGRFVTQREQPRLALVQAAPVGDRGGLALTAPGCPKLAIPAPEAGAPLVTVTIWESVLSVPLMEAAAHEWFSAYLGVPVRLVYLPDAQTRPCTSSRAATGDEVSFADAFALLLTTMASLDDLNGRMGEPLPMDRFRANIVVEGAAPWDEDEWRRVKIGETEIELLKPCARCKITTTDQATAGVGREPLATLRKFRFNPDKQGLMFGMNASPRMLGVIRVGDAVEVLLRQPAPEFRLRA